MHSPLKRFLEPYLLGLWKMVFSKVEKYLLQVEKADGFIHMHLRALD